VAGVAAEAGMATENVSAAAEQTMHESRDVGAMLSKELAEGLHVTHLATSDERLRVGHSP